MASNSATHNIPVVEGKWAGRLPEHRLIQPFVVSDWQNERISDAVANEVGRITRTQWNAYKDNHQSQYIHTVCCILPRKTLKLESII